MDVVEGPVHDGAKGVVAPLFRITTIFGSRKSQTEVLDDCGAAVHGQSFAKPAVTDDLAANCPEAGSGYFNMEVDQAHLVDLL
jgi:hypothetical protein